MVGGTISSTAAVAAAVAMAVVICFTSVATTHAVSLGYRFACIELSTAISCVNRSLDSMPSNLPKWTKTLNLNNNHISQVDKSILQDLHSLEELKMNKNRVKVIHKENFGELTNLKVLELNRNQLENITALSFHLLEHVTALRLRRNKIRNLPDGAFFGLSRIKQLQLDYNFIESIKKTWLYNLESLTSLSISNNRISSIDNDAWEFCKGLIELDLSSNALKYIRRDSLRDLSQLQVLNLQNNFITNIEESAFSHTPNLIVLNLNINKISWSIEDPNGVYRGLNNLRNFSVASNEIKSVNKHAFQGLSQLRYLDLNNNNIGGIQLNAFKDLPHLEVLALNTSALLCDCNLQWFYDFLSSRQLNVTTVCSYPEWLRGRSLLDVPSQNFTCDNLTKPRIIEEPEAEIMALKDESIALTCRAVSSSPSPMVFKWKKDNVELRHPANMTVSATTDGNNTESVSVLTMSRVQDADAGKYQCVVSNSFGTSYTKKSNIAVLIYPTFDKIPSNITVQAGATAKLVCSASGEPQPEIAWQKDGGNDFPAARERRMQVMSGDDVFFIISAKLSDMGVYSCTAHNAAGRIVANATLIVEERPSFSKPMENKTVKMGESVVIQCMAGGSPKPTIQWFKDDVLITPTERHFFTAEEQLMIIVDSVFSDAGNYTCKLNNTLGVEVGHSTIIVKPGNTQFSDMMGIIIITVVSCAVLTSFIWVVIIYQTRKGMNRGSARSINATGMLDFPEKQRYPDNASEHSSCKDSGTGDSAKRSNDDLMPPDEYTLIINETNPENKNSSMRAASMVYLSAAGGEVSGVSTPLLHTPMHGPIQAQVQIARSTNHDRQEPDIRRATPSPPPPPPDDDGYE